MDYLFDDDAAVRSKRQLLEQLPHLLRSEWNAGSVVTKRSLYAARANDTPIIGTLMDSQLSELRDAGEVVIIGKKRDKAGNIVETVRERAESYSWDDVIKLPREPTLFSVFTQPSRTAPREHPTA